jgi:hypothetical protein
MKHQILIFPFILQSLSIYTQQPRCDEPKRSPSTKLYSLVYNISFQFSISSWNIALAAGINKLDSSVFLVGFITFGAKTIDRLPEVILFFVEWKIPRQKIQTNISQFSCFRVSRLRSKPSMLPISKFVTRLLSWHTNRTNQIQTMVLGVLERTT